MDPSSGMCSEFMLEIWNGPQLGYFVRVLVGNWDSDVIGPSYGGLVGQYLKARCLVQPMGLGWGDA